MPIPRNLTLKTQEAIESAHKFAQEYGQQELSPLHLLLAIVIQNETIAQPLLKKLNVDLQLFENNIKNTLDKLGKVASVEADQIYVSSQFVKVLEKASGEAKRMGDSHISIEHLILALVQVDSPAQSLLVDQGLDYKKIEHELGELRGSQNITDDSPESKYQALEKYGIDLTDRAKNGKLDPVIGRDEEIRRVMQVLSRRTKNNPVLIGEPGVGKTAIVEGLAQRIVSGDVPDTLKNRKVISLDLAAMLAGAKFRGEFEDRLRAVLKEITASGNIITFIDELHTVVGAGASEGSMDASNMLKPMLARGELHTIGATTLREYREHIEKDAALERRFQPVLVEEPSIEDTIAILRGLKDRYEVHHGIRITDPAIIAAATLSKRYISNRFLPDKAVDLIDEAASSLKMQVESSPVELDQLKRRVTSLEIEKEALKKEKDEKSKTRLKDLENELSNVREESNSLEAKWLEEKKLINKLRELTGSEEKLKNDLEKAQRDYDLELAAKLQYGDIPKIQKERLEIEKKINARDGGLLREEVTEEDIAKIVSRWTGVPVSRLVESETQKLANLEDELHKRVISQDEAVTAVSRAIRRSRAGISDPNRPIGSFIFLGPTGVGKTELARSLAYLLFNDEDNMVRIDMSEYMESHSVSRLIGSPPGYIGHDEGGQLTEAVRRKPYSVVLFDEIEKAHSDIFNTLLQVLDAGRLTDGRGRTVDFRNTIIIMTSNLGSQFIQEAYEKKTEWGKVVNEVLALVRKSFRPEFINRIDEMVVFKSLSEIDLSKIVKLQLDLVVNRLAGRNIILKIDSGVEKLLTNEGFDPLYGARPLKRAIQDLIIDELALEIIEGKIKDGDIVHAKVEKGRVVFRPAD